jgi:hypothetical protein
MKPWQFRALVVAIVLIPVLFVLAPVLVSTPSCSAEEKPVTDDVNRDGKVTLEDMEIVLDLIIAEGYDPKADLNGDGKVDVIDLDMVREACRKASAAQGE